MDEIQLGLTFTRLITVRDVTSFFTHVVSRIKENYLLVSRNT